MKQELYYTDVPFIGMGDRAGEIAPVREIKLLAYDGKKYVTVRHGTFRIDIIRDFIYTSPGRAGNVTQIPKNILNELPREYIEGMEEYSWSTPYINIDGLIHDVVHKLFVDDRKNDDDLPMGLLEKWYDEGLWDIDDMCEAFRKYLWEVLE